MTTGTTSTRAGSNLVVGVGSTFDSALYGIVQTVHPLANTGGISGGAQWSYSMIQAGQRVYGMGMLAGALGRIVIGTGGNANAAQGLTIDTDNTRLGIGQQSPAYTLDVTGTSRITSNLGVGVTPLGTAGSVNVSDGYYVGGVKQPVPARAWTPVLTNVTQSGQTFTRDAIPSAWNSQVYSTEGYPTAYVSFTVSGTSGTAMMGLNSDPTTDASYVSIDYAWYADNGTMRIFENSAYVAALPAYTSSTIFQITYDGVNVRYYADGTLYRTVARALGSNLYLDSSIDSGPAAFNNVVFGPYNGDALVAGSRTYNNVLTAGPPGVINGNSNLTFNGTTLTSPAFSGPLTGNVTGNCSGTASNLSGTPNISVGTITATGALPWSGRSANPLSGQLIINGPTQRLVLGSYYTGGAGASSTIQASDFYSSLDHGTELLLNPLGGNVGIGCNTPGQALDVAGTARATAFSGPLTGNVTGNCSGTASNLSGTPNISVGTITTTSDITGGGNVFLQTVAGSVKQIQNLVGGLELYAGGIGGGQVIYLTTDVVQCRGALDMYGKKIYNASNVGATFGRSITSATTVVSPFAAYNGDINVGTCNFAQIEFQHYNGGGYTHYIGSRHDGGAGAKTGNAIDFYLYSNAGGAGTSSNPNSGNVRMMSVTGAGVGINCNAPGVMLDVNGTVRATAFSGPLTGNVTGNCSGSSGTCTGNAATATNFSGTPNISVGTIGCGAITSTGQLKITEATGTSTVPTTANTQPTAASTPAPSGMIGSLTIAHTTGPGQSSIVFPSATNASSDYAYITYMDDVSNAANERSRLLIGADNDPTNTANSDGVIIQPFGGYVGIGQMNPVTTLDVNGGLTVRNGFRPLYSAVTAASINPAGAYGTHYNITNASFSSIVLPTSSGTTDLNAYWVFRNNTGTYLLVSVTYTGTGGGGVSTLTIPPSTSTTIMFVANTSGSAAYAIF